MSQPAAPEDDLLPDFVVPFSLVLSGALGVIPVASRDAVGVGLFARVFVLQMLRRPLAAATT